MIFNFRILMFSVTLFSLSFVINSGDPTCAKHVSGQSCTGASEGWCLYKDGSYSGKQCGDNGQNCRCESK